ncbi:hypothetical protein GN244_ATG16238 [Phytophthora infestans]|uniref:Secreted protein n=1 Tax=Phytophthora infestans TaxID=4787 RepID=A0A833SDB3_PHYIN|nr:hypothetical protein GN244_ATG16238 [Phytophthora infestans]KAF4136690.1 hypothetical protein GN958_ATG14116 [Phytophthora infestans]
MTNLLNIVPVYFTPASLLTRIAISTVALSRLDHRLAVFIQLPRLGISVGPALLEQASDCLGISGFTAPVLSQLHSALLALLPGTINTKAIFAIAAVAIAGSAAADTCSSSQQTSAYTTLASLLTLVSFQGCVDDSGYSLLCSTSLPTRCRIRGDVCINELPISHRVNFLAEPTRLHPDSAYERSGGECVRAGQRFLQRMLVSIERLIGQHQHSFDDVDCSQHHDGDNVGCYVDGHFDHQRHRYYLHDVLVELDGGGYRYGQLGLNRYLGYGLLSLIRCVPKASPSIAYHFPMGSYH